MWWMSYDANYERPTLSIGLVIALQALLASTALFYTGMGVWIEFSGDHVLPTPGFYPALAAMIAVTSLLAVSAFGLFKLRNWAIWLSLGLVSVVVLTGALGLLLYKRGPAFDFTPFLFELLLKGSLPVCVWWWILFTRHGVREQFH